MVKPLSEELPKKKIPTGKEILNRMNRTSAMMIAQDDPLYSNIALNPQYDRIEYWDFYKERMLAGFGIDLYKNRLMEYMIKRIETDGKKEGVHGKSPSGIDVSSKLYMATAGLMNNNNTEPPKKEPKYNIGTREGFRETSINEENNAQQEIEKIRKLQNEVLYLETRKKELREDISQIRSSRKQGKNNDETKQS